MLEEYQLEIIVFVVVIILFIIFLVIKAKKKSNHIEEVDLEVVSQTRSDEYDVQGGAFHDEEHKEYINNLDEKQFIKEKEQALSVQEKVLKVDITPQEHTLSKRSVPPHGKITKEDFKEFAGYRILLAEDNIINQKVIKGLLANTGIEIKIANDGQEALDILENDHDFLMILMDAHMPRVDGFEATRKIRQNPDYNHILVVSLSGDTAVDDVKKMKAAGMSEQLEKPLRISNLYDIFYAYTDANSMPNILNTQEINGIKGLEVCGGDEEFYADILHDFFLMYENSSNKLTKLLQDQKIQEADILLVDIIGVTANIGAQNLNETAYSIKLAISHMEDKSYNKLIEKYATQLHNLITDIKKFYRF